MVRILKVTGIGRQTYELLEQTTNYYEEFSGDVLDGV